MLGMDQTTPGIGQTRTLPTTSLNLYHKNPRMGDVDAIAGSLQAHGQFRPIVVNEGTHTGRPMETLAGNHTLKAIRQLAEQNPTDPRWAKVEAYVIDVDEDRAARIVLADNRTADLGGYDNDTLLDLLGTVDHDLDGTGYDYDDLEDLQNLLDAPENDELGPYEAGEGTDSEALGDGDMRNDPSAPPLTEEEYKQELDRWHEKYTHAAKAPTYTPQSDEPPALSELYDTSKTQELLAAIDAASSTLPPDVTEFLRHAAHRHTVINFKKVAEWYAHQPGEIQELAEQQVLVIIDLEDALREGYATLTDKLRQHALKESGYDDSDPNPENRNPHLEVTPEDEEIRRRARDRAHDVAAQASLKEEAL